MPIHQAILFKLWPFGIQYIPELAAVIANLLLLHKIEVIKPDCQSIHKVTNVACRV